MVGIEGKIGGKIGRMTQLTLYTVFEGDKISIHMNAIKDGHW